MRVFTICMGCFSCKTPRYRGVGPPIMQKTICTSLMFGTFDFYRRGLLYIRRRHVEYVLLVRVEGSASSEETILIRLIASCCSGLTEALLTPFERVQTLMQIPSYNSQFKNFFSAFRQMGVREMYTGLRLSNSIPFIVVRSPCETVSGAVFSSSSESLFRNCFPTAKTEGL